MSVLGKKAGLVRLCAVALGSHWHFVEHVPALSGMPAALSPWGSWI